MCLQPKKEEEGVGARGGGIKLFRLKMSFLEPFEYVFYYVGIFSFKMEKDKVMYGCLVTAAQGKFR